LAILNELKVTDPEVLRDLGFDPEGLLNSSISDIKEFLKHLEGEGGIELLEQLQMEHRKNEEEGNIEGEEGEEVMERLSESELIQQL
jgi:hypothetical protein